MHLVTLCMEMCLFHCIFCTCTHCSKCNSHLYCCCSEPSVNRSYWEWAGFPSQSISSTLREYWPWLVSRYKTSLPNQCSPNTSPKPCRRGRGEIWLWTYLLTDFILNFGSMLWDKLTILYSFQLLWKSTLPLNRRWKTVHPPPLVSMSQ